MGFQNNTFPLAVYGLQDVFSTYIVFLKIWTSNSDPNLIGRWYLENLYKTKGKLKRQTKGKRIPRAQYLLDNMCLSPLAITFNDYYSRLLALWGKHNLTEFVLIPVLTP